MLVTKLLYQSDWTSIIEAQIKLAIVFVEYHIQAIFDILKSQIIYRYINTFFY